MQVEQLYVRGGNNVVRHIALGEKVDHELVIVVELISLKQTHDLFDHLADEFDRCLHLQEEFDHLVSLFLLLQFVGLVFDTAQRVQLAHRNLRQQLVADLAQNVVFHCLNQGWDCCWRKIELEGIESVDSQSPRELGEDQGKADSVNCYPKLPQFGRSPPFLLRVLLRGAAGLAVGASPLAAVPLLASAILPLRRVPLVVVRWEILIVLGMEITDWPIGLSHPLQLLNNSFIEALLYFFFDLVLLHLFLQPLKLFQQAAVVSRVVGFFVDGGQLNYRAGATGLFAFESVGIPVSPHAVEVLLEGGEDVLEWGTHR